MNLIALLFIFVLIVGVTRPITFLLYCIYIMTAFSSLAIIPVEITGGTSITGSAIAALLFVIKALLKPDIAGKTLHSLVNIRKLGFLGAFLLVAIPGAFTLPFIFEGTVRVYMMRSQHPELVMFTTSNFTQTAYVTVSILVAATVSGLIQNDTFARSLPKAILVGAYVIIASGLTDVLFHILGVADAISYLRTANYAFLTENEVAGARRIIGFMPEASAFGSVSAGYCATLLFLRPVFLERLARWVVPMAAWGCGVMAFLSTSSAAYIMMGVTICLYIYNELRPRSKTDNAPQEKKIIKLIKYILIISICVILSMLEESAFRYFTKIIDSVLLKKASSSSYIERSQWTYYAVQSFFSTDWVGLGLGSVRTSNFFANILACTGLLGSTLFGFFLCTNFTQSSPKNNGRAADFMRAAKLALVPSLICLAVVGTTPDFGVQNAILFGVIAGLRQIPPKSSPAAALLQRPRQHDRRAP